MCRKVAKPSRRANIDAQMNLPLYDAYIPRDDTKFYNCTNERIPCEPLLLKSIRDLSNTKLVLKSCYLYDGKTEEYKCETIKYAGFKNIDKLLFLTNNIHGKIYYLVDCLLYPDRQRVCLKKDVGNAHSALVDLGAITRPNESNVLSQDDFICEEDESGHVDCDLNQYIPYLKELKVRESSKVIGDVLLKTNTYLVKLKYNCLENWCGYSGEIKSTRRDMNYRDPGGKMYKCYIAKRQQVCKEVQDIGNQLNNERRWLNDLNYD